MGEKCERVKIDVESENFDLCLSAVAACSVRFLVGFHRCRRVLFGCSNWSAGM